MKVLVAYYSRTNVTKKVGDEIAKSLNTDVEEIISKVKYDGKIGYARAGKDAMGEKIIDLEDFKYNPSDYDLVYLGVPVWVGKAANPIISYIKQNEGKFNDVRFFATAGSSDFDKTFKQMQNYVGKAPQKTLGLTTKEVKKGEFKEKLSSFID
ncbi:flavodoxin [uncultured Methanobrevibacter sp.]|uniref:flavodoxin family protein n=1 Tax=uncultured Methanobrevibacter sp. TaxID=253161 RepID=UPI0025DC25DD|nr:flavodoxin [uncultured Methanobrevibacter sp.]